MSTQEDVFESTILILNPNKTNLATEKRYLKSAVEIVDSKKLSFHAFQDAGDVIDWITNHKRVEPVLFLTDSNGVKRKKRSTAEFIKTEFPRCRCILYSDGVEVCEIVELQNVRRIVDRYVSKREGLEVLASACAYEIGLYYNDMIIESMREYLRSCKFCDEPVFEISGNKMTPNNIYQEVVKQSEVGILLSQHWRQMLVSTMKKSASQVVRKEG